MVDDPVFKAVRKCEFFPVALIHGVGDGGGDSDDETPLRLLVRAEWLKVAIESHGVCVV